MPILTTIGAASARNYGLFGKTGLAVDYTVVAGGNSGQGYVVGGGSVTAGPGGGAGQLLYVSGRLLGISSYSVIVGGGGAKNVSAYGVAGSSSSFNGTTAAVGTTGNDVQTSGAGYVRGNSVTNEFYETAAAGGGGGNSSNGFVGSVGNYAIGGNGGSGSSDVILGITRAGGGGGVGLTNSTLMSASGGSGAAGGGNGAGVAGGSSAPGGDASANYGSGGGAGSGGGVPNGLGGNGGSGIVIIRYSDIGGQRASGGTVTQSGGYYIHTFTGSGTFTVNY